MRTARHARSYERTAKALEAGDVSATHVEIMAGAANKRDEIFRDDEDSLLDIAPTMPPDEFQVVMRQWRNRADERLLDSGGFDAAARCYLRGTPALGNLVKIDGMLETDDWATVRAALDPLAKPDTARSVLAPRSARARGWPTRSSSSRRSPERGRVLVGACGTTSDVVIDLETLLGGSPQDLLSRVCEIDGVGPISLATAERLLCDCSVGRVLIAASRKCSTSVGAPRCRRGRNDAPSPAETSTAASPAAIARSAGRTHIIWCTGFAAGRPISTTSCCCAVATTRRVTKVAGTLVRNIDGSFSAERASGRAPPCRVAA